MCSSPSVLFREKSFLSGYRISSILISRLMLNLRDPKLANPTGSSLHQLSHTNIVFAGMPYSTNGATTETWNAGWVGRTLVTWLRGLKLRNCIENVAHLSLIPSYAVVSLRLQVNARQLESGGDLEGHFIAHFPATLVLASSNTIAMFVFYVDFTRAPVASGWFTSLPPVRTTCASDPTEVCRWDYRTRFHPP